MTDEEELAWWMDLAWVALAPGKVMIRSQMEGEEPKYTRVEESRLQEAMDRAAKMFSDPTRPQTPPIPDPVEEPGPQPYQPPRRR